MFQKILVPVDLTDEPNCRLAIAGVQQLNKTDVAPVRVITVLPGGDTFMSEYISEDIFAKATADATHELQQFSEKIRAEGKEVSLVVRHGNVYDEVLQEAHDWGADLILMGSHRPQMSTYFFGSNAARIVRHAPCSVLVLRTFPHRQG
jgi:nucleotide-binding universal stress UspA family protein